METTGKWLYIYSVDDLTWKMQNLEQESINQQLLRALLICLNLLGVFLYVWKKGALGLLQKLTNWTSLLTIVFFAIGIAASGSKNLSLLAIHHLIFSLVLFLNILVVIVYWTVLHKEKMKKYRHDNWEVFLTYFNHSVPFCSILCDFLATDIVFQALSFVYILPFALIYVTVNFIETKRTGAPIYWFLTWKDYKSPIVVAGMFFLGYLSFWQIENLTLLIKGTRVNPNLN